MRNKYWKCIIFDKWNENCENCENVTAFVLTDRRIVFRMQASQLRQQSSVWSTYLATFVCEDIIRRQQGWRGPPAAQRLPQRAFIPHTFTESHGFNWIWMPYAVTVYMTADLKCINSDRPEQTWFKRTIFSCNVTIYPDPILQGFHVVGLLKTHSTHSQLQSPFHYFSKLVKGIRIVWHNIFKLDANYNGPRDNFSAMHSFWITGVLNIDFKTALYHHLMV